MLGALTLGLAMTSIVLWVGAALVGGRLARRALSPLRGMAATARSITADDLGPRLPDPGTGDELAELTTAGADLIDERPRAGLFGLEVAFVHPDSMHGVLAEIVSSG